MAYGNGDGAAGDAGLAAGADDRHGATVLERVLRQLARVRHPRPPERADQLDVSAVFLFVALPSG